jgi:hypothetical protein
VDGFEPQDQDSQRVPSEPPTGSTIVRDGVHTVEFVNTRIPPPPGSLVIIKDAPDDDEAQATTFRFRVECPGVENSPFRREITGDGNTDNVPATETDVDDPVIAPGGTVCTVHEFTEDGWVSLSDQEVTIISNQTVTVTFTNERVVPGDGSLIVVKDAPDDAQDVNFTFRVSCPGESNTVFNRDVTGDGESEPVNGIAHGTICTVHEDPISGFVVQPDQQKTIIGDQENFVTFVNTRTTPPPVPDQPTTLQGDNPPAQAAVAGTTLTGTDPPPGTQVRGVQIERAPDAPAAQAVVAQPRFTG